MNKFEEDFELVHKLCELNYRERTILNYGIEEGRCEAINEFLKEIKDWHEDIKDNEYDADKFDFVFERIYEIAEQMKGE